MHVTRRGGGTPNIKCTRIITVNMTLQLKLNNTINCCVFYFADRFHSAVVLWTDTHRKNHNCPFQRLETKRPTDRSYKHKRYTFFFYSFTLQSTAVYCTEISVHPGGNNCYCCFENHIFIVYMLNVLSVNTANRETVYNANMLFKTASLVLSALLDR